MSDLGDALGAAGVGSDELREALRAVQGGGDVDLVQGFIRPSYPYKEGKEPTDVDYQVRPPSGGDWIALPRTPLGEAVTVPNGWPIRYRFVWSGEPSSWNDEGLTFRPPV